MNLTSDEKKVLKELLEKEIAFVKEQEAKPNQPPQLLAAEVQYEALLTGLLKKL